MMSFVVLIYIYIYIWVRKLTDLFLQQLLLHPILISGLLEMLDDSLEDEDWFIRKISLSLELL